MRKFVKTAGVLAAIFILALYVVPGCQQQNAGAMAQAKAKAVVDKVMQLWNEGNLDLADEVYNPDVVRHDMGMDKDYTGIEAQKEWVSYNRKAFPDLKMELAEMLVQGDSLAIMWTFQGTNTGPMDDMPPTGKQVKFEGVSLVHLTDGKATEIWDFYNQLDILQQLGYTVTPPAPPEMKK